MLELITIRLLFYSSGNGNVGVIATAGSYLHLALSQPMSWLKLPFSPLVTVKISGASKPSGGSL